MRGLQVRHQSVGEVVGAGAEGGDVPLHLVLAARETGKRLPAGHAGRGETGRRARAP